MKEIFVIDTNVLLVSLSPKSPYSQIFDAIVKGTFDIAISNEILLEYQEIVTDKFDPDVFKDLMMLFNILENVKFVNTYFNWNLIPKDLDDNKFVDVAVAVNAKAIVTNDKHFRVLESYSFPKVNVISAERFIAEYI